MSEYFRNIFVGEFAKFYFFFSLQTDELNFAVLNTCQKISRGKKYNLYLRENCS